MTRVAVVGTGFGGIAAAVRLRQAGIDDVVLFDKSDDVGGVWRENATASTSSSGCETADFAGFTRGNLALVQRAPRLGSRGSGAREPTAFDGRSDYDAFIDNGIPAGGLFTGAEDPESAAQVKLYGGLSTFDGEPVWFDSCYHQACDSLDPIGDGADARLYRALNRAYGGALTYQGVTTNINQKALGEMSDAAAHAILTFALQDASVKNNGNGTANAAADGTALGHHDKR